MARRSVMQRSGSRRRPLRSLALLVICALAATSCSDTDQAAPPIDPPPEADHDTAAAAEAATTTPHAAAVTVQFDERPGASPETEIRIELDDGTPGDDDQPPAGAATVTGDPLDPADLARLVERLPDLEADVGDQTDFMRPPSTQPPPTAVDRVDSSFPPADATPAPPTSAPDEPLQVLRWQPDGPVDLAPALSVTFNQPMIALGTVAAVDTERVPITITPELPGRWVWLGTKSARFEYEPGSIDRLPAATHYVVEIPAGTRAADGQRLDEAVQFEFSTPAVQIRSVQPLHDALATDPVFIVEADQRIDPTALLTVTELRVDGSAVPLRLATDAELEADEMLARTVETVLPERWYAFTPAEPLPTDAELELLIGPARPSLEGPVVDDDTATFAARTRGEFTLVATRCGWDDECRPGQAFALEFSNPIDHESFAADMVSIDPPIVGARIGVNWNELTIQGRTAGQTTYEVTVSSDLTDVFGQDLGTPAAARITVGDAEPALFHPGRQLVTLDPMVDTETLAVTSINHDRLLVRTYEVDPATDWIDYLENNWRLAIGDWTPNWPAADDRFVPTGLERNAFGETLIDLSDALASTGHAVVLIGPERRNSDDWRNEPFAVWVQRTQLGLDVYSDEQTAIARVTNLASGQAVPQAQVELIGGSSATTDTDGVARLDLGRNARGVIARAGDDRALLGEFWAERWDSGDSLRWHVLDDRAVYKPGETVSIKGWVRRSTAASPATLAVLGDGAQASWIARDQFGNEIGSGPIELGPLGGFDLEVALPDNITLGYAHVEFTLDGLAGVQNGGWWHEFQVQEFRRPDFEVVAAIAQAAPFFAGDTVGIDVTASYLAGGSLADSPVDWLVAAQPGSYSPPSWPDFEFGIGVPWWLGGFRDEFGLASGFGDNTVETRSARTDDAGADRLAMTIDTEGKPQPISFTATATVVDVNRQPISGSATGLIHPADLYVGIRRGRSFVQAGEPIEVDVIVTDLDGTLVVGREVSVAATRLESRFEGGSWVEVHVPIATCDVLSDEAPVACTFDVDQGGRYQLAATVADDRQRSNLTEVTRWVAGEERPATRRVDLEQVTLVPNGTSWQPGETAELLVQSPFADAHGLAIISQQQIDRTIAFEFEPDGSAIVSVPITDDDVPGVMVQVEIVGTAPRDTPASIDRPAYASGQITLDVPPDSRRLTIDVAPRSARLEPGTATTVDVAVTDRGGNPVADAELAVIIVDEAVLSLSGYELGDPLASFYPRHFGFLQSWRGRATLRLADPGMGEAAGSGGDSGVDEMVDDADSAMEEGAMESSAMADDSLGDGPAPAMARANVATDKALDQPAIDLRSDFEPLAVFEPDVRTDANGRATIEVPLPDNVTRYRVMVVAAAAATDAGLGESSITARLPLTVRPTPPRFANFGDRFDFPVVVQNATDEPLEVDVALRATNLDLLDPSGISVVVPADDRVEVRFPVAVAEAGTARYQVVAAAGDHGDAAQGSFSVFTPATAEAFATYGVIDNGVIAQALTAPVEVFPQFGGIEIATASTAVSALTDAVIYLSDYRYESTDALASRIMAIAALGDILDAFDASQVPSRSEMRTVAQRDVEALATIQNDDGGFPYWRRGRASIPYNSVQATHALVLAQTEGLEVDQDRLDRALAYLRDIEQHMPNWYDERTRVATAAYAVHARFLAGDVDIDAASGLLDRADDDQLDVAAWLWPVVAGTDRAAEIERHLTNRVTETANGATFATDYGEQAWVLLHSDRRTDAVVLDALLRMRPESDLVPKTLNGLLAARGPQGAWSNIQENSFVLLAGAAYFDRFESADPDFVARAWLGNTYAVEHEYRGRNTTQQATLVPMDFVVASGDTDIVVENDGEAGRLYYRLGLRYAPTDFDLEPLDRGFVVERRYEAVDDSGDVEQNNDGSWTIRAGARVRVRVSMVADSRRTHVALIDPMPAGFEALNPALATSEPIPFADPGDEPASPWRSGWFEHQNLRDDRAEAFATWLGAGTYDYAYVTRATTPGTFVVPPSRAEMMYEPEVFGRSDNTTITIVDGD